jgi:glycosyltransferase involved in cell wall biosynthesis
MDLNQNELSIAVVTVNLNNVNGLIKTINSLINQTDKKFEFIIIDGGSTDGSFKIIEKYKKHIDYWVSEIDKGVYNAMNKGLEKVTSDYCLFLNSGDYLYDEKTLEKVKQQITKGVTLIYGSIKWEDSNIIWNPKKDLKAFEMTTKSVIPHQGAFFNTLFLKKLNGYKENFKVISDWGIMLEIIGLGCKTQKLDQIISICEKQGISAKFEYKIKKERLVYLLKYDFKNLILGILYQIKKIILK